MKRRSGILAGVFVIGAAFAALAWALLAFQVRSLVDNAQRTMTEEVTADAAFAAALVARVDVASLPRFEGRRLTVVAADGRVEFDSVEDAATMDNHGNRPEVIAARRDGQGVSRRHSETVGRTMLYVARSLPDGRVVRVSAALPSDARFAIAPFAGVLASSALVVFACYLVVIWRHWRAGRRALELRAVASAFVAGEFGRRASLTSDDAIGQAGRELNALGERLQATLGALDGQRSLLDGALGALDEGVACIDRLDRVVYANPAFARLAAGGGEVAGRAYYEHLPARLLDDLLDPAQPGRAMEVAHGGVILAASAASAGDDVRVLVLRDLTAIKRLERTRRDFMTAISHEFKTPLTAIAGFAETLLDGALERDAAEARGFVERIARHAARLGDLVQDMLALARLEQGAWQPRRARVDLVAVAGAVVDEAQAGAAERGVRVRIDAPPSLAVTADAEAVRLILGNLVSNAVRYNRPGGEVVLRLAHAGQRLAIEVSDTGIGIPTEHQARVFDRFYRIDEHRSRQTGGTGLGLAIVKQLVDLLGGTVGLASSDAGSRFTVELPASAPA